MLHTFCYWCIEYKQNNNIWGDIEASKIVSKKHISGFNFIILIILVGTN